jgi:hypothetical protein
MVCPIIKYEYMSKNKTRIAKNHSKGAYNANSTTRGNEWGSYRKKDKSLGESDPRSRKQLEDYIKSQMKSLNRNK